LYADRLSVNIEIPTESGLKLLAPDKDRRDMIRPMNYLKGAIEQREEQQKEKSVKPGRLFAPAGQSTQMIIGATGESDKEIMYTAHQFYKGYNLKRVYYSGYVPVSADARLPGLQSKVPVMRENRLYQTDWLMRFYGFDVRELLNDANPHLEMDIDPKLSWALRNMHVFPVDVNNHDLHMILRVPGIGVQSAHKIVTARKFNRLSLGHLKKIGVAVNRARYFISCDGGNYHRDHPQERIRQFILNESKSKYERGAVQQGSLF
jgi:putative DNA modification/repair radical SAM protein